MLSRVDIQRACSQEWISRERALKSGYPESELSRVDIQRAGSQERISREREDEASVL